MSGTVAEVVGVTRHFGAVPALEDVSLDIRAGECLALVGHNGSGKSTLIRVLLGFVRPDSGQARVLGQAPDTAHASTGYLPENIAFDGGMTGRQVLRFYARLAGLGRDAGEPLLEMVGLAEAAGRRLRGYSKGMRQRLGLAQALLGAPRLLLLDEPTTGLDPRFRRRFYDIVADLKERGCAVLISSHVLSELDGRADRIAILAGGRLLALGTLAEIRAAAGLPARIRVRMAPCHSAAILERLPEGVEAHLLAEDAMILSCRPEDKLALLRSLATLTEDIRDIETLRPTLDEIYGRFAPEPGP